MPAPVTASDVSILADALTAAGIGDAKQGTFDEIGNFLGGNNYKTEVGRAEIIREDWDANGGTWSASALAAWRVFLSNTHALAGSDWDYSYSLSVRIADSNAKIAAAGTDPNPGLLAPAKEQIGNTFQAAKDGIDTAIKSIAPNLKGIGSAIMWGAVIVGLVLILYAIGPALGAGASIYKTHKETE